MIDYDTYYSKHSARYYGCLPAAKSYKKRVGNKAIKYFTLCAEQAIDVFMLEHEKLLNRDERGRLSNVVICERYPEVAAEIQSLVRPPFQEAIFVGPLERILTFVDNEQTQGRSPEEDVRNRHIREMLRIKGLNERLKKFFPFDIINFDTEGNLLNHNKEANRLLYQAFEKIFELQTDTSDFLLFITIPISDIDNNFQSRFRNDFDSNIDNFPEVRASFDSIIQTTSFEAIEENKRIAIAVAKSVIMSVARNNGWNSEHKGIYIYENRDSRKMLNSVVQFSKANAFSDNMLYIQDIIRIIQQMPDFYSYQGSLNDEQVKNHLQKIIKYRESIRGEYSS